MNLLPVAILGGAAWYLSRPRRNPQLAPDDIAKNAKLEEILNDANILRDNAKNADDQWRYYKDSKLDFLKETQEFYKYVVAEYYKYTKIRSPLIQKIHNEIDHAYNTEKAKVKKLEYVQPKQWNIAYYREYLPFKEEMVRVRNGMNPDGTMRKSKLSGVAAENESRMVAYKFLRTKGIRDHSRLEEFWYQSGLDAMA